jgi:2'-hydroxyisoflavone reductase
MKARPMRLLVIGGTRFIGRHIVDHARAAGHQVTVFHRGVHPVVNGGGVGPELRLVLGDRNGDLSVLQQATLDGAPTGAVPWDAVIDTCAYTPDQVHHLADTISPHTAAYVLLSTVSVYDDPPPRHDATAALREAPESDDYGALKVRCEHAARSRFGESCLIVRPTYVVGPHDYSWRFPWWVTRLARGGTVLAPGPPAAPVQLIDGRDLAAWIVRGLEGGLRGTYHTVGPLSPLTFGGLFESIASLVAPAGTELMWVDGEFLSRRGLSARDLPLWAARDDDGHTRWADPGAALRAGLVLRPLTETITDTLRWARSDRGTTSVGLDPGHEKALLRAWRTETG